jgi:hypothetical protein
VLKWLRGIDAGLRKNIPDIQRFFTHEIIDTFHLDRATRAVQDTGAIGPIKERDVPYSITDLQDPRKVYRLQRLGLSWSSTTPRFVLNAVSIFLEQASPDRLWIARYKQTTTHTQYDPIIYAEFGEKWDHGSRESDLAWQVEVVRWD